METKNCNSCFWYATNEQVCCNSVSKHCADFKTPVESCNAWEPIDLEYVGCSESERGYEK